MEGAAEAVEELRGDGRRVLFLTNNSARTPEDVASKLRGMGIPAEPDEVLTSAQATAAFLARDVASSGRRATAFVVGERGIVDALGGAGIEAGDPEPDYVVVGWDRGVDYDKLRRAAVHVRAGARLVATNADATYPAPGGELWPGAGSLLAAVETASGRRATVIGKPHRPMFDAALERVGTRRALVVGDRLETDVAGAAGAGLDAALVLSGAAALADLPDAPALPVAVLPDLGNVLAPRPAVAIRRAASDDLDRVAALADPGGRFRDEITAGLDRSVLAVDGEEILATAAADVGGDEGYLRAVATDEAARGLGIGALAVAGAARLAGEDGATRLSLLTEEAEGFFARLGFERTERGRLPAWILDRSRECPDGAVAMTRPLRRLG